MRFVPLALVFLASACVMVIELVAFRLVARHVGTSLYTWTSIIAVVLAGLSLGNYLGGRLADHVREHRIRHTLGLQLVAASALSLAIVWVHWLAFDLPGAERLAWPVRILIGVAVSFLLPAVVLGSISPVVARWALEGTQFLGRTVGNLYAWGSLGAIAGTLATGFLIIPLIGTTTALLVVSLILALSALAVHGHRIALAWAAVPLLLVAIALAPWPWARDLGQQIEVRPDSHAVFHTESAYQAIRVDAMGAGTLRFMLDDLAHGYVRPDDLAYLGYDYLRLYAAIVAARWGADELHPAGRPESAATADAEGRRPRFLLLGGGAYNLPRFLAVEYPGAPMVVAELDPAVTRAARQATGLDADPPFRIVHQDARQVVRAMGRAEARVDFVFGDAFRSLDVPAHLTTLEFQRELGRILTDQGMVVTNVVDDFRVGRFLGAFVNTAAAVFPHVQVYGTGPTDERVRDTFVVVASLVSLDSSAVLRHARASGVDGAHLLTANEMAHLRDRSRGLILTDDHAPVENLLAAWQRTADH